MNATWISRKVVPFAGFVTACGALALVIVVGIEHLRREPLVASSAAPALQETSQPALSARDQQLSELTRALADTGAVAAALAKSRLPGETDELPALDIARIEPTGDAVVAGRAAPGSSVELLRDGQLHHSVLADESGHFVMVPPRLPPGNYALALRSRQSDGQLAMSKQSVVVSLEPNLSDRPVVALMTPDKPSLLVSQPSPTARTAGAVAVDTVETEAGGKLHVSGHAQPGAAIRLYLNDSFVASVTAGADGRFAVTINKGVTRGGYRVRLDEVDPNSGSVRARAEVPFNVPEVVAASAKAQSTASQNIPGAAQVTAAVASVEPEEDSLSAVVVPKITTTTVASGDSLWRISRLSYGLGKRYAVIYKANREQIRNPNRIYPGQIFVLPTR
jgi:nucleoid-associated protein YgaU